MVRRRDALLALLLGLAWLMLAATVALGAEPSPAASSAAHETLITTNARVGEELVWWGLRLMLLCFAGLALAAALTFVKGLLAKPAGAADLATGGLGLTDLLAATLKMVPDLIKTPAGIAAMVLILGVLMLLGTAAIEGNQLSDTPIATEAAPTPASTIQPIEPSPSALGIGRAHGWG